jgi:hypothetical protein
VRLPYSRRIQLSRAGVLAQRLGMVLVAVVVLFSAVFLVLAATSWAADRQASSATQRF